MKFFKKIPLLILSVTALCLFAWSAQAQNSVIPYQGTLFSQGKPVSQSTPIRMAFAIYSDSAGLEAGQDGSAPSGEARKWTSWDATGEGGDAVDNLDETVGVQVRNGRFLVHLGEAETGQQSLGDDVFDASELYVVAWVMQDPQNPNAVFRLPPQRLQTVPHAVTAKRATKFTVTDELKVDGTLRVIDEDSIKTENGKTLLIAETHNAAWTTLEATFPGCQSPRHTNNAYRRECQTAIHRYCRNILRYVSGFGPVEDNAGIAHFICVGPKRDR
jgi:hypothetical protein